MLTRDEIQYIMDNIAADTARLLLGAKPAGINVPLCVKCIEGRKKMKIKAPLWHSCPSLVYPFSVSVEQGSSQATALFKQQLIQEILHPSAELLSTNQKDFVDSNQKLSGRETVTADLTGGMGIDSYFISQIADTHYYFERNTELCEATAYNFRELGANNIIVSNRDITADDCAALDELKGKGIDLLYIDPARRDKTGGKAILLQEYEPNIVELQEKLFEISPLILVKVSPMGDITLNLKLLPQTAAVYIVSTDNECKELLFLLRKGHNSAPSIVCCDVVLINNSLNTNNIQNNTPENHEHIKLHITDYQIIVKKDDVTEKGEATYTSTIGKYLYEPSKGWLKAGAFNLVSERYGCGKLAASTHLYTSDEEIADFPGKRYEVEEVIQFNKKSLKELARKFPKADITARNFPLDTNALKKLAGIKDGGNRHIFATTLHNGTKVLIVTLSSCTTC
jgi:hypothetical protein